MSDIADVIMEWLREAPSCADSSYLTLGPAMEVEYHCNYIAIENEEDRKDAISYLELWKKFTIQTLKRQFPNIEVIDEQRIYKPKWMRDCLTQLEQIAIKFVTIKTEPHTTLSDNI